MRSQPFDELRVSGFACKNFYPYYQRLSMLQSITIGQVSAQMLATQYGTPLYVYDEQRIRANARRVFSAFRADLPAFDLFYAIKANANLALAQILVSEGLGIDTSAPVEIAYAQKIGLAPERVLFSGNYSSDEDLQYAMKFGCFINLDDLSLLDRLLRFGKPQILCFRVNPDIGKSNVCDEDIVVAGQKAKFGIPHEKALAAYALAQKAGIKRFGIHMMTGSCITDAAYFAEITSRLMDVVGRLHRELGIVCEFVNIGGGLGIPYLPGEAPLDIELAAKNVAAVFLRKCAEFKLTPPKLMMEPGRYFVGDAGFLLGRVHALKQSYQNFVGTDIGFTTLMRPTLYEAYHHIRVDGKENQPRVAQNLCGQLCENTDVWCRNRELPKLEVGDLIVLENAGAYGHAMSSSYNGRLRPAEVLVNGKEHRLIRRRETVEDVLHGMIL